MKQIEKTQNVLYKKNMVLCYFYSTSLHFNYKLKKKNLIKLFDHIDNNCYNWKYSVN